MPTAESGQHLRNSPNAWKSPQQPSSSALCNFTAFGNACISDVAHHVKKQRMSLQQHENLPRCSTTTRRGMMRTELVTIHQPFFAMSSSQLSLYCLPASRSPLHHLLHLHEESTHVQMLAVRSMFQRPEARSA